MAEQNNGLFSTRVQPHAVTLHLWLSNSMYNLILQVENIDTLYLLCRVGNLLSSQQTKMYFHTFAPAAAAAKFISIALLRDEDTILTF